MHATIRNEHTGNMRALVTRENILWAQGFSERHLDKVIEEKGFGTFTSRHEALGAIRLEYRELEAAMQEGKVADVKHELGDMIAACQFTLACINAGTMDW